MLGRVKNNWNSGNSILDILGKDGLFVEEKNCSGSNISVFNFHWGAEVVSSSNI